MSFIDNNETINTIDIDSNKVLLKNTKIESIISSYFFNNSLFILDERNNLKSFNIKNKNIFWKINLSNHIDGIEEIVNITSFENNLLILFDNGILIKLNPIDGLLISQINIGIKDIILAKTYNNIIFLFDKKNKIYIFSQ